MNSVTAPGLRFDKVATRLVERLQRNLAKAVPRDATVLVTITAPIRLPAKTADALEETVRALLTRGSTQRDKTAVINGNSVRIRVTKHASKRAPRVLGFVHNSGVDPILILDAARDAL